MSYHSNLIKLAALGLLRKSNKGGATEDNEKGFVRGYPTELFLYLINLVGVISVSLNEVNNLNFARVFLT